MSRILNILHFSLSLFLSLSSIHLFLLLSLPPPFPSLIFFLFLSFLPLFLFPLYFAFVFSTSRPLSPFSRSSFIACYSTPIYVQNGHTRKHTRTQAHARINQHEESPRWTICKQEMKARAGKHTKAILLRCFFWGRGSKIVMQRRDVRRKTTIAKRSSWFSL